MRWFWAGTGLLLTACSKSEPDDIATHAVTTKWYIKSEAMKLNNKNGQEIVDFVHCLGVNLTFKMWARLIENVKYLISRQW